MDTTIKGKFFIGDYNRIVSLTNREQTLEEMFAHLYPKGTILTLAVSVSGGVEKLPACNFETEYRSKCGTILDADGTCPSANYHKKAENAEEN